MERLRVVASHLVVVAPAPAAAAAGVSTLLEPWREQLPVLCEAYARDGFVLVSGLIPEAALAAAEEVVWDFMEEPTEHWLSGEQQGGFRRDDPRTWPAEPKQFAKSIPGPEVAALWTQAYLEMGEVLSEYMAAHEPAEEPDTPTEVALNQPKGALAINILPHAHPEADWSWPSPHIDHSIEEHGFRTFPKPVRMSTMTYLADAPTDQHAGSTVVWPGSHRKIAALAASDPVRFELMHELGQALQEAGVMDTQPVEVKAKRGDVLFYDILTAHSGSENHAPGTARLAFNMKWGVPSSPKQE